MERISCIIATYNCDSTLRRAINSVLAQQGVEIECICVDGLSKDDTIKILQSYDNRIRYVSEKDKGIFDALNKGVQMARYEWIYILGADDEIYNKTALRDLLSGNDITNKAVVYGNVVVRYPNGQLIQNHSKHYKNIRRYMFGCHQGIVMKRSCILNLNGFNLKYKLCADFDLIQRAYLQGYTFKQTQVNVAYYFSSGASSTLTYHENLDLYRILKNNHSVPLPYITFLIFYLRSILRSRVYNIISFFKK